MSDLKDITELLINIDRIDLQWLICCKTHLEVHNNSDCLKLLMLNRNSTSLLLSSAAIWRLGYGNQLISIDQHRSVWLISMKNVPETNARQLLTTNYWLISIWLISSDWPTDFFQIRRGRTAAARLNQTGKRIHASIIQN